MELCSAVRSLRRRRLWLRANGGIKLRRLPCTLSLSLSLSLASTKMAAALGLCLVSKTVFSSYRSNNTYFKYSKWKEKALKNSEKPL